MPLLRQAQEAKRKTLLPLQSDFSQLHQGQGLGRSHGGRPVRAGVSGLLSRPLRVHHVARCGDKRGSGVVSVSTWRREPNNPYPEWSGCWMAFNNAAHRERLLSGPGYLYAIERESDHAIKIGMSHKPRERFIGFRSSYEARHDRYSLLWIVPV